MSATNAGYPIRFKRIPLPGINHAVLLWAAVVAVALLSCFVHLLHEQVERGAQLREQFRLAARTPAAKPARSQQTAKAVRPRPAAQAVASAN